jgi:hypothetical protein
MGNRQNARNNSNHRLPNVRNWLGTTFIILGFAVLAIKVSYLDVTVLTLAPDHGVELSDCIGAAALLAGVIALW